MCPTSFLLHQEVIKNIGAWCDFFSVSELTGNAGNYPFSCAGTKTEFFKSIEKLSLTSIKQILPNIKMHQLFIESAH